MNNSTVNFTMTETSTNFSSQSIQPLDYAKVCMYMISFMFAVPANVYVIWLIVTGPRNGAASEIFNLNMYVCEIAICLNFLFSVIPVFFPNLVILPLFLQGLNMSGRGLFQSLICVERYLAVVHPVTFLKYKPLRYRVICCSVAWMIVFGSCFYNFFMDSENDNARVWCFSVQSLLFFFIQLFCLVAVLRALKQSGPGERKREKEENHMKRRAFYLILITTISTVIAYVPFIITGYFIILTQNNLEVYWFPGTVCFVMSGFVQPVLYLHRVGKFSVSPCLCSL